jgi:hypothetical protein
MTVDPESDHCDKKRQQKLGVTWKGNKKDSAPGQEQGQNNQQRLHGMSQPNTYK